MKTKEIQAIESYFTGENEHWNEFAFTILCETIQEGQFDNLEVPLQLWSKAVELFLEHHKQPLKAVQLFSNELDKAELNGAQKVFVNEKVHAYLKDSEFDGVDLAPIRKLLRNQTPNIKTDSIPSQPLTANIRDTLKELIQKELETLPESLKELEPLQRLNLLCKLMPFVMPKVDSVHHTQGEPDNIRFNDW